MATQNSIEHEGTYPLPEAQLDRFLMHVLVALPDRDTELAILDLIEQESAGELRPVSERLGQADVLQLRKMAARVHLSPALKDYVVRLVMATRDRSLLGGVADMIEHPVSPRGTLALAASARARALLRGRDFTIPEDVQALAADVLAHRLVPTWRAIADGKTARGLITRVLDAIEPL